MSDKTIGHGNNGYGFLQEHRDGTHQQFNPHELTEECPVWVKGKPCKKALVWRNPPKTKAVTA